MTPALLIGAAIAAGQVVLPAPVEGDFDRDGKRDVAAVERRAGGYALVVRRGSGQRVRVADLKDARNTFLAVLPDGTLSYGSPEASQAVVRWTGDRFLVTWVTD